MRVRRLRAELRSRRRNPTVGMHMGNVGMFSAISSTSRRTLKDWYESYSSSRCDRHSSEHDRRQSWVHAGCWDAML